MILRRDHIAGVAFVAAGALVYAFSGDLPWGSLAMPGAGMMPKLVLGLMIIFGLVLLARGGASPPLSEIDWSDRTHALCLIVAAALATALYTLLGFVLTMSLLLFGLTAAVRQIQDDSFAVAFFAVVFVEDRLRHYIFFAGPVSQVALAASPRIFRLIVTWPR